MFPSVFDLLLLMQLFTWASCLHFSSSVAMASPRTNDQMLSSEWVNEYLYFILKRWKVYFHLEKQSSLSSVQLCNPMDYSMPGFLVIQASLSFTCSNSCPLSPWWHPTISSSVVPFSSCLQSFTSIRVFSSESDLCIRWPKYWSFSFSISLSSSFQGSFPLRILV